MKIPRNAIAFSLVLASYSSLPEARAQLIPDNTLDPNPSIVTPIDLLRERIDGGAIRGANLFHSFLEFNVGEGRGVFFTDPPGVENILTRVTGSNSSNILGTLGVLGNANFFLINPNGIYFGPNVRLAIGGSFLATTGDRIQLGDTAYFSATDIPGSQLLSVRPEALFSNALRNHQAQINNEGNLIVGTGQNLTLLSATVTSRGSLTTLGGTIQLWGDRVRLINSAEINVSSFTDSGDIIINAGDIDTRDGFLVSHYLRNPGNIILNASRTLNVGDIDAIGPQGGTISLTSGETLSIDNRRIRSVTTGSGVGGDINLTAPAILVRNGSLILNAIAGVGQGGNINFTARSLLMSDGATAQNITLTEGLGGNVIVNVADRVEFLEGSGVGTTTLGSGNAGNVTLNARQFLIRDALPGGFGGTGVTTASQGGSSGNAGDITINVTESLEIIGNESGRFTPRVNTIAEALETAGAIIRLLTGITTATNGSGNAGVLTVNAGQLIIRDGAAITAGAVGASTGSGGRLQINVSGLVELQGKTGIATATFGPGDAGEAILNAREVTLRDGAVISADTLGAGNAANLTVNTDRLRVFSGSRIGAATGDRGSGATVSVNAADSIEISGVSRDDASVSSGLFTDTIGSGNAGNLEIATQQLILQDGGAIAASTTGMGQAGRLNVTASDSIQVLGWPSRLFFDSSGSGDAGQLNVNTRQLIVRDGGRVSAATSGTGRGGILDLNATESVEISGGGGLFFDSRGTGNARGLRINTGSLVVTDGGQVTVSGTRTGVSGDLDITADSILLDNRGRLRATTALSEGGNIRLQVADSLRLRHNSEITAEALGLSNGGNIAMEVGGFVLAILKENSDVVASAEAGRGGNIRATATGILGFRQFQGLRTPESDFTATSVLGIDGAVSIDQEDRSFPRLPPEFLNVEALNRDACAVRNDRIAGGSSFVATGRGGLPESPGRDAAAIAPVVEWVSPGSDRGTGGQGDGENLSTKPAQRSLEEADENKQPREIRQARGWIVESDGTIILTAEVSNSATYNLALNPQSCQYKQHQ